MFSKIDSKSIQLQSFFVQILRFWTKNGIYHVSILNKNGGYSFDKLIKI
jgi:hypothetical protein